MAKEQRFYNLTLFLTSQNRNRKFLLTKTFSKADHLQQFCHGVEYAEFLLLHLVYGVHKVARVCSQIDYLIENLLTNIGAKFMLRNHFHRTT